MINTCFSELTAPGLEPPGSPETEPIPISRSGSRNTNLVYDDAGYQDAYDLIRSEPFKPSSRIEHDPITCAEPISELLNEYAEAATVFHPLQAEYQRISELCRVEYGLIHGRLDKEGRFRHNPILEDFEAKMGPAEKAYWTALARLDDALTVEAVVCINQALTLAGVTDDSLKDEICRVVIKGGKLWDGGVWRPT